MVSSQGITTHTFDIFSKAWMLILLSLDEPSYRPSNSAGEQVTTHDQHMEGNDTTQGQSVRFSSVLQQIEPEHSPHTGSTLMENDSRSSEPLSPEAQEEIRKLSKGLQQSHLEHRMTNNFAFEPVSLPVSRVSNTRYPTFLICEVLVRVRGSFLACSVWRIWGSAASSLSMSNKYDPLWWELCSDN